MLFTDMVTPYLKWKGLPGTPPYFQVLKYKCVKLIVHVNFSD